MPTTLVSRGVPVPGPGDRKWLLLLTELFLRRGSHIYFRKRPVAIDTDPELSEYYAGGKGVVGWDLWYARRESVKTTRGIVTRIENVTRVETGETTIVYATQLFKSFVPDLGLRSPRYTEIADISRLVHRPLKAWLRGDVDPEPRGGELSRVTGVFGLIFEPMRSIHTRHPRFTPDPLLLLLTRRMQYHREMPRGVWRRDGRPIRWTMSPVLPKGITSSTATLGNRSGWWDDALHDSHGTPMPRPPTAPKTVDPRRRPRGNDVYLYKIIVGTRQIFTGDPREYLVLWSDNRTRADQPVGVANDPNYVEFTIRDATWVEGDHFDVDVPLLRNTTLPRVRCGGGWKEAAVGPLRNVAKDDSYALASVALQGNPHELLREAGKFGSFFHRTITHLLLKRGKFASPLQCGWLGLRHLTPPKACAEIRDAINKRVYAAQKSWFPVEAYVPLVEMSDLCLRELRNYYTQIIGVTEYDVIYTEYPVRFTHLVKRVGHPGTMHETNVDAIVTYTAPPAIDRDGDKSQRIAVVEFKSVYGEKKLRSPLPERAHVAQAILNAYMLEENVGVKVDRVTLIYVTRLRTVEVYDYAYNPPTIEWQRNCVLEWAETVVDNSTGYYYVDPYCVAQAEDVFPARQNNCLSLVRNLTTGVSDQPPPLPQTCGWRVRVPDCWYEVDGVQTQTGTLYRKKRDGENIYLLRWPDPEPRQRTVPLETLPRKSLRRRGLYRREITAAVPRVMQLAAENKRVYPANRDPQTLAKQKQVNQRVKDWCAAQDTRGIDKELLARQLARRFGPSRAPEKDADGDAEIILTRAVHRGVNRKILSMQNASPHQREVLKHHQQRALLSRAALDRYDAAFDQEMMDRVTEALAAARL